MAKAKKVILTRKTLGICLHHLKQVLHGRATYQYFRNQKPSRRMSKEHCSMLSRPRGAVVSMHPFAKKNQKSDVLIHVYVDTRHAFVFHEGDVFYFQGGRKITVDCKSSHMFSCRTLRPLIYRDLCVIKSQ